MVSTAAPPPELGQLGPFRATNRPKMSQTGGFQVEVFKNVKFLGSIRHTLKNVKNLTNSNF